MRARRVRPFVSIAAVAALALVLPGCTSADAGGGGGDGEADCEAAPLGAPVLKLEGAKPGPAGRIDLSGEVKAARVEGAEGSLTLADAERGEVTLSWKLPRALAVDVRVGAKVSASYRRLQGFEGVASGLVLKDDAGPILLVDDGGYGNALEAADLAPFAVAQEDAGCRNRKNQPGSLNNFWLVVSAGAERVKLIHGGEGELAHDGRAYRVLAIASTSRVGDVTWTDAPYEHKAFAIARAPGARDGEKKDDGEKKGDGEKKADGEKKDDGGGGDDGR